MNDPGCILCRLTSSKDSLSLPPRVEKYFIEESLTRVVETKIHIWSAGIIRSWSYSQRPLQLPRWVLNIIPSGIAWYSNPQWHGPNVFEVTSNLFQEVSHISAEQVSINSEIWRCLEKVWTTRWLRNQDVPNREVDPEPTRIQRGNVVVKVLLGKLVPQIYFQVRTTGGPLFIQPAGSVSHTMRSHTYPPLFNFSHNSKLRNVKDDAKDNAKDDMKQDRVMTRRTTWRTTRRSTHNTNGDAKVRWEWPFLYLHLVQPPLSYATPSSKMYVWLGLLGIHWTHRIRWIQYDFWLDLWTG